MKQNRRQIEANLRNKLAKSNNDKYNNLQERFNKVSKELYDARRKVKEAESYKEELEEKIRQYEDWINRLQEFCDMNKEDRQIAIKEMRVEQRINKYIAEAPFFQIFKNFSSII